MFLVLFDFVLGPHVVGIRGIYKVIEIEPRPVIYKANIMHGVLSFRFQSTDIFGLQWCLRLNTIYFPMTIQKIPISAKEQKTFNSLLQEILALGRR